MSYLPAGVIGILEGIGPRYACSKTGCVGWLNGAPHPETAALFKQLQAYITIGLRRLGRRDLTVDGIIGAGTLAGYQAIRAAWPPVAVSTPKASSINELAANALRAVVWLSKNYQIMQNLPPVGPTGVPAPPSIDIVDDSPARPPAQQPVVAHNPQQPQQPTTPMAPSASGSAMSAPTKTALRVVGAVGLIGVAAWYFTKSPKKK